MCGGGRKIRGAGGSDAVFTGCGSPDGRSEAAGGRLQQAPFDNWPRDRHQNEIMLVNLSSINYPKSRPRRLHYSRKSLDWEEQSTRPRCCSRLLPAGSRNVAGWSLGRCSAVLGRHEKAKQKCSSLHDPIGRIFPFLSDYRWWWGRIPNYSLVLLGRQ